MQRWWANVGQGPASAVAVTVLAILLAFVGLAVIIMLVLWSKDGTFKNTGSPWQQQDGSEDPRFVEEIGMRPIVPGMSYVHKHLIAIGLLALLVIAILLLVFTILIHEFRERVTGTNWDPINNQTQSGWERENTRLRVAACSIAIILCLLSFVPWPRRTYVYILAFGFLVATVLFFVAFAMDVTDLRTANDFACPPSVYCIFHPYNTVVALDFICGFLLVIFLLYEHIVKHKQSTVTHQRELPGLPLEEYVPAYDAHPDYEPVVKPGQTPYLTGPAMRPLLGVEVIEVEHPATGELNVTVMNVTPGSAAEEAGMRVGDIISRWDEIPITCKADFAQAVSNAAIGSDAVLQVIRQAHTGPTAMLQTTTSVVYCKLTVRGVAQ